jgi:hypothetical protein
MFKSVNNKPMDYQVWSDNETEEDLIGFRVHAELIRSVVTDAKILPVVLGIFGDWGSGKSSIMRMLQKDLDSDEKTICLYFNGWMFEGYEDAKTALLSSILIQIGEHKRFGEKAKDKVVGLLKRVKWMEVAKAGLKHVGLPFATALITGGVGGVVAAVGTAATGAASKVAAAVSGSGTAGSDHGEHKKWSDFIEEDPGKPDLLEVRKFREEFAEMLAETDIASVVILIDDLDRCLPERIIETLEAIKLFAAVPKTAFVIGADPRIVRHAIATRYVKQQIGKDAISSDEEQYDLIKDYLEKLIQVPYHLPRLSPAEIETYMNLLACQKALGTEENAKLLEHWLKNRKKNMYAAYRQAEVCEALGSADAVPKELVDQLSWSNSIADVVTEGLKGNPRQVKRMLNAMALRKQLAKVADIKIRDEVLAKLMVLEYVNPALFREMGQWQVTDNGFPKNLQALEKASIDNALDKSSIDGCSAEWFKPAAKNWLCMQPALSDVDLRDYFWLARDKTNSTLSGVAMVAPIVRRLFESLISGNKGEQKIAVKESISLGSVERRELLSLLSRQIERHPDQLAAVNSMFDLADGGIAEARMAAIATLKTCPTTTLNPGVFYRVKMQSDIVGVHQSEAKELIAVWAKDDKTQIVRAALIDLKKSAKTN